jgi:uncharacterized protein YciI
VQLYLYHLVLTEFYRDSQNWTDKTYATTQQHAEFLESLGKEGVFTFAGRTDFGPEDKDLFGIAVIKAGSIEKAKQLLADDPAVIAGIQQASVFPFSMGIRSFENLQ